MESIIKVSIVVPVYNVSDYINRCIQSVMNQTYQNIECIIVDDVTPDDSIEKCEKLIAGYTGSIQFKILHHTKNRGLSAARNTGTEVATGNYIYYLDSDDEITPNCIEKLVAPVLIDFSVEIVQGNTMREPNRKKSQYDLGNMHIPGNFSSNIELREFFYTIYRYKPVNAWNKLINKDFLFRHNLFFKEGLIHEDEQWMYHVLRHLRTMFFVYDFTYIHYITEGSIMTEKNREKSNRSWERIFLEVFSDPDLKSNDIALPYFAKIYCSKYADIQKLNNEEKERLFNLVHVKMSECKNPFYFLSLCLTKHFRGNVNALVNFLFRIDALLTGKRFYSY